MSILDQIIQAKQKEVQARKKVFPTAYWEQSPLFARPTVSLKQNLQNSSSGIIAEHKRRSPSKAVINQQLAVEKVVKGYAEAGACGLSILTDGHFFGGSLDDLSLARAHTSLSVLRKDFIIDPYQLIEAKAFGADVVLLIAAVLDRPTIKQLSEQAQALGLEVLLEVHNAQELEKALMPSLDLIGVNNRNLKTFEVSLDTSKALAEHIPDDFVKVSESGIHQAEAVRQLQTYGYQGFLVGENFMKTANPGQAATQFIKSLNHNR